MAIPPPSRRRSPRKHTSKVVKIIVAGAPQSGKTTLIRTISQYTEIDPRSGWFFGRIRVDHSLILHLLEPPVEQQYDFMWLRDVISRLRATGFIVMLDSSRPQQFAEFISILYTVRGFHSNVPLVVAANRQEHRRAWSVSDIQIGLGITDTIVQACSAPVYNDVRDTLITLLNRIPAGQ